MAEFPAAFQSRESAETREEAFWQLTRDDLDAAISRLTSEEKSVARSELIFPVIWFRNLSGYAVCGEHARQRAKAAGLNVVAYAPVPWALEAFQRDHGNLLAHLAASSLRQLWPQASASRRLTLAQAVFGLIFAAGLALSAWFAPVATGVVLTLVLSLIFLATIGLKAVSLLPLPRPPAPPLARLEDADLPVYTVLVPLCRETSVLDDLFAALLELDYPADKLDIKLILEQSDITMRRAVAALALPEHIQVLTVPSMFPQTKPKALNYALWFARGELVTIYDAEDEPASDQLRQAAAIFAAAPPNFACLQARLAYYNASENWLTRQFALEYAALFDLQMPFLAALGLPMPLGGTSNHIRMSALRHVGGWDAYNVTEDADLGFRLARAGFGCGVMASTTLEEANCRLGNWLHQRARWFKGWIQTWLVHMRQPLRLLRELGVLGFLASQVLMIGVVLTVLLHPIFLGVVIWQAGMTPVLPLAPDWLSVMLVSGCLVVLIAGYAVGMLTAIAGARRRGLSRPVLSALGIPVYWCLISIGGWLALWQFITSPFHWNKTEHGLTRLPRRP